MTVRFINSGDEARLSRAVESMYDQGGDPLDSAVKVASDHRLLPGELRLVCHAFNSGRQVAQIKQAGSATEKLASFPLVDAEEAVRHAYGPEPTVKAAYDPHFDPKQWTASPPMVKAAKVKAAAEVDGLFALLNARQKRAEAIKRANDAAEADLARYRSELQVLSTIRSIDRYFSKSAYDRIPFGEFVDGATAYWGSLGQTIVARQTELYPYLVHEKSASCRPIDRSVSPWRELDACQSATLACREARIDHQTKVAAAQADQRKEADATTEPLTTAPAVFQRKRASIFMAPAFGTLVGTALGHGLQEMDLSRQKGIERTMEDLSDPAHQDTLRGIRTQVMLNQAMSDPDDPISGEQPEKVLSAFNELAEAAPHAAQYPAVLRPLLRRQLVGRTEPFEVKEMLDINKQLQPAPEAQPNARTSPPRK